MTPVWRALSACAALVAGFAIPIIALIFFLGVLKVGAPAVAGLVALAGAVTLLLLVARRRLRI